MLYYIDIMAQALQKALGTIPDGKYAVGVSGGADSVALLLGLKEQPGLSLHVVHLNHQTRGKESEADAQFVAALAGRLGLACTVAERGDIEKSISPLPANPSARYRTARLELFGQVVQQYKLQGVILAHHADDQAETVLHRLLRGGGVAGLAGMAFSQRVREVIALRPLLEVRRDELRKFLMQRGQDYREDASNQSDKYFRNRLRKALAGNDDLTLALLSLAKGAARYRDWARRVAPKLENPFRADIMARLPAPVARQSALRWLVEGGASPGELTTAVLDRLIEMARDAASANRRDFPAEIHVRRKGGKVWRDDRPGD